MRRCQLFLVLFFALMIPSAGALAQTGTNSADAQWVRIAEQDVAVKRATVTLDLSNVDGKFRAFAISSGGSLFTVRRARFTYADGRVHTERRFIRLRPGLRSKPIDRRATGRFVDKAQITFRVGRGGRGYRELEIWGLQTETDRIARRDGSTAVAGTSPPSDTAEAKKPDTDTAKPENPKVVIVPGEDGASPGEPQAGTSVETAALDQARSEEPEPDPNRPPPLPPRAAPGDTAPAGDVLLGAQSIGFAVGQDLINVGKQIGKFDRVRLRVLNNDVMMKDVRIFYSGGTSQVHAVNERINRQRKSAWFDLNPKKFLDRIELSYEKRGDFDGRARIEAFGKHADGWLGPDGEGRRYNDGWVLLAAQTAGFIGFDKDDVPVGANNGGFDKIRVTVRERAIMLNKIKVIYNDGKLDVIPVKTRVDAGSTYGPISLRGSKERIAKIQAVYRSRYVDRSAKNLGSAIVEFWAKH